VILDLVLAALYLFVSLESVAIQTVSLVRLRGGPPDRVHRHLVRTVTCRVAVMSVYSGIGVVNLIDRSTLSIVALAVYTGAALLWQVNSLADVRLRRDLTHDTHETLTGSAGRGEPQ
jgi:hypothetical protein